MRISDWSSDVCSSDLQRGRSMTRRIGILTSGGDCAGLNAVIRAVAIHATRNFGWTVVGIEKGTAGLMARPVQAPDLDRTSVASGTRVSGRVDLGGGRIIIKKRIDEHKRLTHHT